MLVMMMVLVIFLASEREASFDRACFPRRGKHSVARSRSTSRNRPGMIPTAEREVRFDSIPSWSRLAIVRTTKHDAYRAFITYPKVLDCHLWILKPKNSSMSHEENRNLGLLFEIPVLADMFLQLRDGTILLHVCFFLKPLLRLNSRLEVVQVERDLILGGHGYRYLR